MTDLLPAPRHLEESEPEPLDELEHEDRWHELAACRGTDVSLFFTARGDSDSVRKAKATCAACPAAAACLEEAVLDEPDFGVWGGTTVKERQRIRRETGLVNRRRGQPWTAPVTPPA